MKLMLTKLRYSFQLNLFSIRWDDPNLGRKHVDSSGILQVLDILCDHSCFLWVEKWWTFLFTHVTALDPLKNDWKSLPRKAAPVTQRFSFQFVCTCFQFIIIEHLIGKLEKLHIQLNLPTFWNKAIISIIIVRIGLHTNSPFVDEWGCNILCSTFICTCMHTVI